MRYPMTIAAALLAAACVPATEQDDAPATKPERDSCGSSAFSGAIGTPHENHDFKVGDRPVRIIPPNSAVTMDYLAERLNVDIDENGIVTRVWCG